MTACWDIAAICVQSGSERPETACSREVCDIDFYRALGHDLGYLTGVHSIRAGIGVVRARGLISDSYSIVS